jgi:hypothetical protein
MRLKQILLGLGLVASLGVSKANANEVTSNDSLAQAELSAKCDSLASIDQGANISGNIKFIHQADYGEINLFGNKLPLGMDSYSFLDVHKGENAGHFGKTDLAKEVKFGIGPVVRTIHGNELASDNAIGFRVQGPLPFDAFGSVKVFPKWTKSDKITMDYFLTVPLPKGFNFSTFGEVSLNNDPEPIEFTYGEASLDWSKGPLTFGYNPAFIGNKDLTPKVQHRFAASYNF